MKKNILVVISLAFISVIFFIACEHEIPHDFCASDPISLNLTATDASSGQSNGIIEAHVTGGNGFQFSLNGAAYVTDSVFNGLQGNTNYRVVAKNSWGCTDTAEVTIGQTTPPNPCAGVTITVSITKTDASPNQSNGSITATAAPGSGYTYSLNNGPFQSGGNFTGLAAGNYTVTAKNSNGCTGTGSAVIGTNDPCAGVTVVVTTTQVNPVTGQSNGSITASATGGSGFTYRLNNGAYQSSGNFTGLATGNYTITAKNSNGCIGTKTVALGSTNPCAGVTVVVSTTQVNPITGQSNGSITATATGGSGFTYSLNNGAFQSSGTFTGLATGNYTITAKNSNGCTGTKTVALGSTNPCSGVTITVSTTKTDPTTGQSNGSITATATGGTGFTYSLNGGAYQTSGTFSNLAAGNYTVTAKSSQGCLGTKTVTLTAANPCTNTNITIISAIVNVVPCSTTANNGKITVTASGSSGYTYNINGGAYQASNIFGNLAAGTYTVGVKDLNGCTKTASAVVGTAARGPLFAEVRTLITNRCGGSSCHMNGGNKAGYNFDNDCSIVTAWSAIRSSCVTSNSMPNPPQPLLTAAEKQKITDWINAGHTYGN